MARLCWWGLDNTSLLPPSPLSSPSSSSSLFSVSFLHHLQDAGSWWAGPLLQLSHGIFQYLWALPQQHWRTCQLWSGPTLHLWHQLFSLCRYCHSPYAQLARCHDGWHPMEDGHKQDELWKAQVRKLFSYIILKFEECVGKDRLLQVLAGVELESDWHVRHIWLIRVVDFLAEGRTEYLWAMVWEVHLDVFWLLR